MEKEVCFYSNNIKLTGILSLPENKGHKGNFPVAVLSHGYGASKDEFGDFAFLSGFLNTIGMASLRFDFRGCGNSGALPGRMLCGSEWPEDLRNAVTFVSTCSNLDPDKICIIGESMGAAAAILAASEDNRVKCVIALSPIADGFEWIKRNWVENKGKEEFDSFLEAVKEDVKREVVYGQSSLVSMPEALAYRKRYLELIEELRKKFNDREFTYYVQYASISSILSMKPINSIRKISPRPLLILAGKKDAIVPAGSNAAKLFEEAGETRKLTVFDHGDHGLLAEPARPSTLIEITEWLEKYLKKT